MTQDDLIERLVGFFRTHTSFTRWVKRLAKIFILFSFLGIIFGYSMLKYSKKPEFCTTCHYMQPFYDAWATSSHNHVSCIECHYAPGIKEEVRSKWEALSQVAKYVTGTYGTKPWAEISDRSCLRSGCHDKRLLRGQVVFNNVLFDHSSHLTELRRGKRLRCTSCHSQIVQGEHMTVTRTTCVLCHFKGQEEGKNMARCTLCHTPPTEPVTYMGVTFTHSEATKMGVECTKCHLEVTQGSGNVPKERCYSCHLEPDRIAKFDDSVLLHDIHITEHKVECTACHLEMEHKIASMSESISLDCNSCHPDHHAAQKELYMGIGGKGVPHQPDPMFLTRVNCEACHIAHEGSKIEGYTSMASSAACMACHGVKFGNMLGQWETEMAQTLAKAAKAKKTTQLALEKAVREGVNVRRARQIMENAVYNIDLVEYGRGVHNIRYSQQLIYASIDSMKTVLRLIGSRESIPAYEVNDLFLKSTCYQCHFGMYSIVDYNENKFPHDQHVHKASIPCQSCHLDSSDPGEQNHGRLSIEDRQCASCHHQPEADCSRCHQLQTKIYQGEVNFTEDPPIDFMAEAEVECEDCHLSEDDEIVRPTGESCTTCHDESYAETQQEWQEETADRLEGVKDLLRKLKNAGSGARPHPSADMIRKFENMLENISSDGSRGVHNYQLVDAVLGEAEEALAAELSKYQNPDS